MEYTNTRLVEENVRITLKHAPLLNDEQSEEIGHPSEADALTQEPVFRAWIKQIHAPHGLSSTQSDNEGRISSSPPLFPNVRPWMNPRLWRLSALGQGGISETANNQVALERQILQQKRDGVQGDCEAPRTTLSDVEYLYLNFDTPYQS